jgi:PKD repeat protein
MNNPAPQTDLFAHEDIGGKTVLYLGDGLYATPWDHRVIGKFNMYPFNNDWTNSLFFSQDPVALDSVMYDFLHTEGTNPIEGSQNYLHQSAEPLTNTYDPENDGSYLSNSLGVHEHWDINENIFSTQRYSGPSNDGIDYISYKAESIEANAYGPYESNTGEPIQFTGNATGGTTPYFWYWNFGNGDYSTEQNPSYSYTETGNYTVILTVTDQNNLQGTDITAASITGPDLSINALSTSLLKLTTTIKNTGATANDINWRITLTGGAFIGTSTEGTIPKIPANDQITITSNTILGLGPTTITIDSWIEDGPSATRTQNGFIFLFFIYITPGGG